MLPTGITAQQFHPGLPTHVEIIDCTLRDGEQAAGVSFSIPEKIDLAQSLSDAGIRILDAGFPAASGAEREAMQSIRAHCSQLTLIGTARPLIDDVTAVEQAHAHEIALFAPVSQLRLSPLFGRTPAEAERMLTHSAEAAAARDLHVNIVFEDATRADPIWLAKLINRIHRRIPLHRVLLADTVGCGHAASISHLFALIRRSISYDVVLCAHCHNDFGLASANSLAAISAGAHAVTCTINGIGERAGNADLAEIVAALTYLYEIETGVVATKLLALSEQVEKISGIHMSATKPVTGFNAFRHESGVHINALLKHADSYEFLSPSWLGKNSEFVLGKHSGSTAVRAALATSHIGLSGIQQKTLLAHIKHICHTQDKTAYYDAFDRMRETRANLLGGLNLSTLLAPPEQKSDDNNIPE
ncbi:LeuA family protein [Burkholderia cenocepacia]|uniref:LeuA family protein n=1 Tax=Burkholderia cenocepacia TaxID=95486 RepID=UPI000F5ABB84|nr:hypothetical protein [Burkholderia cenocepacia]RQU58765.1 hypothetical protein DF143_19825 [Burkholderia cenocepacia]RQV41677.1 hypothetical protein DF033_20920 [Burkholderia cenocepacia]